LNQQGQGLEYLRGQMDEGAALFQGAVADVHPEVIEDNWSFDEAFMDADLSPV
jgi:hypothetical protein